MWAVSSGSGESPVAGATSHRVEVVIKGQRFVTVFSWILCAVPNAQGQGFPPEEAAKRMSIDRSLAVDVVAAEPMIRQPVCIEFDDRGRLWVIQYLQYPNPAGLK